MHTAADISDRTVSGTIVFEVQVAGSATAPATASADASNRKRCQFFMAFGKLYSKLLSAHLRYFLGL